jgi:hypothetical protein
LYGPACGSGLKQGSKSEAQLEDHHTRDRRELGEPLLLKTFLVLGREFVSRPPNKPGGKPGHAFFQVLLEQRNDQRIEYEE